MSLPGNVEEHSYQLRGRWPLYYMFRKAVLEVIHVHACICSSLFYTSMPNGIYLRGFVMVVKLHCKVPHNRITKPSLIHLECKFTNWCYKLSAVILKM